MESAINHHLKAFQNLEHEIKMEELKIAKIEQQTSFQKLTIKEKYQLFTMLEKTLSPTSSQEQNDLYLKLNRIWKDVLDYRSILRNLSLMKKDLKKLLKEFPFQDFGKSTCSHIFVTIDEQLECIRCGHSSQEYHLTEEETKILIDASKEQGLLMEHVAKENIPFLKVLALTNSNRGVDFYQMSLSIALKRDQKRQKKDIPTYYNSEELQTRTLKTLKEQSLIEENCTSSFKDLLIQECQVARQELKILAGENISKLFEEAQSEEERFWIMKAYYNLSRQYFKDTSGYFKNPQDAQMYIYLTANKEINQMILDRRIKRKN